MKRWLKRALVALCSATLALTAGALVGCSSCKKDKACEHEWQETVLVEATCTSSGTTKRVCSKCEEEETITVAAGHKYGEAVVVEATCTTRGSSTYTCSACGDSYTAETINPTGHTYELSKQVEATCTAQGYNEYTCACGDAYTEITADKKGHNTLNAVWEVVGESQLENSCYWVQYEEAICEDCGEPVSHEEEIVKHQYTVGITTAATCSKEGVKTYTCACGDSYTEAFVNANGHAWVASNTDSATGITTWACSHDATHTKTSFSAKDMVAATIPAAAIKDAKEIELQNATLELPQEVKDQLKGDVNLSVDTLNQEDKNNAMAGLSSEEQEKLSNTEIYNFQMAQGSDAVTKFDKEITVTVPYVLEDGADPADIAVWYIDDEGKLTSIKATYSVVDEKGYATFTTDHFSYYTVVRLSAKERCALYGCEEVVTTVAATCEKDGYTLTKCVRCNKTTRSAFVKALGHTYTENTVAPTCTAKGYTTYTCTREGCGYSYASKWVNMLAHEYTATVVAPTCTAKGYTTYTCKGCADTYVDSMVAAKGHAYDKGVCTACGKTDPVYVQSENINFYFNAIEGLLTAETYYVEIKNLTVDMLNVAYENKGEAEYTTSTEKYVVDLQAEVALDESGYLLGKGVLTMKQTDTEDDEVRSSTATGKVVFRNGMIYAWSEQKENYNGMDSQEDMNAIVSQDALLEMMGVGSMMEMLVGAEPDENITGIIESVKGTENSPLNKVIATVMEYVYTKTETAEGYHFEMNFDRIEEVYKVLTEKKVNEVVDLVFGAGAYDAICAYLIATVDKDVSVVVQDLRTVLALCGVELDVVYDAINAIVGEEGFDVRTYVAQYSTMKISDLLDGMMEVEEPGTMDYKAMIAQYAAQLKEVTLMDLAQMMFGAVNGQPTVRPGYGDGSEEIAPMAATEEAVDPIYAQLVEIVTILKKSSFSFDTDKTGEVLSYTVNLVNFGENKTAEDMKAEIEAEIESMGNTDYYSMGTSMVNGKVTFKPNATVNGSFDNIVATGENAEKVAQGYWKALFEGKVEGAEENELYKDVEDGDIWWMDVEGMMDTQEGTYAGQTAMAINAYGNVILVTTPSAVINTTKDCLEWTRYLISGIEYYNVEFTVWMNAENEVIGLEINEGSQESCEFESVGRFYYNATSGKYVDGYYYDNMHNFVLIEHKAAEGCEGKGYYKYSCTLCGRIDMDYYTNGHDLEWSYALRSGAKTCEDGVDRIGVCSVCDKTASRYFAGYGHYTNEFYEVVATTACGDVVMHYNVCPCGKENNVSNINSPCIFDYVSSESVEDTDENVWEHNLETYRCAVTECAYTYTVEVYKKREGCEIYRYRIYRFGVKENSSAVDYTYTEKEYWSTEHLDWHNDSTENDAGLYTIHNYCTACGLVEAYYQAAYDDRGYTTYYKDLREGAKEEWEAAYEDNEWGWKNFYQNLLTGDGWRRSYNGCEYVQYDLEGNVEYEGDMHWWWDTKDPYSDSCTQYQFNGYYEYCYYCREEYREGGYSMPKDHDYYYDEDLGLYVCGTCGMKSETGADAIVIEDLTYVNDGKVLTVGYYNRQNKDYSVYVVVNYGSVAEKYLFEVTCEDVVTHENSGIITINMQELTAAIESLAGTEYEVQTVSLVMQYFEPISGEYDETTGEWEGSYIDCVVTFE